MIFLASDRDIDLPDNVASKGWIIISLEIYLMYEGEVYGMLIHPFYARASDTSTATAEGYLYPAFFASFLDFGMYGPRTVGEWIDKTDKSISTLDTSVMRDEILNMYGIGPLDTIFRETVYEIKDSPVSGHENKLYRVERFVCTPRGNINLRNVTDPHFLKGHLFVPIERIDVGSFKTGDYQKFVKGRKIVDNYLSALSRPEEINFAREHCWQTSREDWVTDEEGYLVLIDIAGFGALCDYIRHAQGNVFEEGSTIANRFRNGIAEVFESVLFVSDPIHSYFTGDGMIVSLPLRFDENNHPSALRRFLKSYADCIKYLEDLNSMLSDQSVAAGTRITIHYGSYEYGRVGGPLSSAGNFSGDSIVELARSETGISNLSKSGKISGRHLIGFTNAAYTRLRDNNGSDLIKQPLTNFKLQEKERRVEVWAGEYIHISDE